MSVIGSMNKEAFKKPEKRSMQQSKSKKEQKQGHTLSVLVRGGGKEAMANESEPDGMECL